MKVSVAEDENTYTSITTAGWSHPWPQRRCSVSLCLVREWFDEKTAVTTHIYSTFLCSICTLWKKQNYIYRMIKNTLFVHVLHLYIVIFLPICMQYVAWICLSTFYEYLTVANFKYNLLRFCSAHLHAQLSHAMALAQLGHLVGLLSLSQDTSKGVESIYWFMYVQLCNEWWYAPVLLVSNLLFSGWPLMSQANKSARG